MRCSILSSNMAYVHLTNYMFVSSRRHSLFLAIEFVLFGNFLQSLRFGYATSLAHLWDLEQERRCRNQ